MDLLLDIIKKTTAYFEKAGLESPKFDAECILADTLGMKRLDLYLQFERPVPEEELAQLRERVRRRARREPLQHILGNTHFFGLSIHSDRRALVPRPETEELVELALKSIPKDSTGRFLDLGTGSGVIALALAKERPGIKIEAVERDPDALALAKSNATLLELSERTIWHLGSWFEPIQGCFDGIISNPPYLTQAEWEEAAPEVKLHDPKAALVADEQGLADLQSILEQARKFLMPTGWVLFETGINQHPALTDFAAKTGYARSDSYRDLSGRERFFIAHP